MEALVVLCQLDAWHIRESSESCSRVRSASKVKHVRFHESFRGANVEGFTGFPKSISALGTPPSTCTVWQHIVTATDWAADPLETELMLE